MKFHALLLTLFSLLILLTDRIGADEERTITLATPANRNSYDDYDDPPPPPNQSQLAPAAAGAAQPPEPGQSVLTTGSGAQPPEPGQTSFGSSGSSRPLEPGQTTFGSTRSGGQAPPEPGQSTFGSSSSSQPLEPGQTSFGSSGSSRPPEPGQTTFGSTRSSGQAPPEPGQSTFGSSSSSQPLEPGQTSFGSSSSSSANQPPEPGQSTFGSTRQSSSPPEPGQTSFGSNQAPEPGQSTFYSGTVHVSNQPPPEPGQTYFHQYGEATSAPPPEPNQPVLTASGTTGTRITSYYNGSPRVQWSCNVDVNHCHLISRVNFVPFHKQTIQGKRALVLDVSAAARHRHSLTSLPNPVYSYHAGRLASTAYFPAQYRNACAYLSYLWSGRGHKRMTVMQRNQEDKCIYSAQTEGSGQGQHVAATWKQVQLQLDLSGGDSAFMLEFQFDIPTNHAGLGHIAVGNFTVAYGNCHRNDAFDCDRPI